VLHRPLSVAPADVSMAEHRWRCAPTHIDALSLCLNDGQSCTLPIIFNSVTSFEFADSRVRFFGFPEIHSSRAVLRGISHRIARIEPFIESEVLRLCGQRVAEWLRKVATDRPFTAVLSFAVPTSTGGPRPAAESSGLQGVDSHCARAVDLRLLVTASAGSDRRVQEKESGGLRWRKTHRQCREAAARVR
jgi:hypothetical protein